MEDPLAVQCNLVGNPLHEEQLEIVRMLGEVYALNTVIDEDRDLVHVDLRRGHREPSGGRRFRRRSRSRDRRSAAASRRSSPPSAGYPLDKTYYQTVKGMVTPLDILEPGGTLIIASACSEGFGSPEFREAQAQLVALGPERFLATLTREVACRDRRVADRDAAEGDARRPHPALHDGPRRRGAALTGVEMVAVGRRRAGRRARAPAATRRSPSSPKDPMSSRSSADARADRSARLARDPPRRGRRHRRRHVRRRHGRRVAGSRGAVLRELAACCRPDAAHAVFTRDVAAPDCARAGFGTGVATSVAASQAASPSSTGARTTTPRTTARRYRRASRARSAPRRCVRRHARHALALLRLLAEAEARVHGIAVDDVHFHELADWDSLMDVVAAGCIAAPLEGARWSVPRCRSAAAACAPRTACCRCPRPPRLRCSRAFRGATTASRRARHAHRRRDPAPSRRPARGEGPRGARSALRHRCRRRHARAAGTRRTSCARSSSTRGMPTSRERHRRDVVAHRRVRYRRHDRRGDRPRRRSAARAARRARRLARHAHRQEGPAGPRRPPARLQPSARTAIARACFNETTTLGLRVREERRHVLARARSPHGRRCGAAREGRRAAGRRRARRRRSTTTSADGAAAARAPRARRAVDDALKAAKR